MVFMCENMCFVISDCFGTIGHCCKRMSYKYFFISSFFISLYIFTFLWIVLYLNNQINIDFIGFIVIFIVSIIISIFGTVLYVCKKGDCYKEEVEMEIRGGYQRSAFV